MAWQPLDFLLPGIGTVLDLAVGGKEGAQNYHENDPVANVWKGMTGQLSEETIAEKNLQYQRERNQIEDARYEEETAYNRAFAEEERDYERAFQEDERDYQRALQQQLFEREDTAWQRQAADMSAAGINPLMASSGAQSGSTAGQASAPVADMPGASSRGGKALNNTARAVGSIGPALDLVNTVQGLYGQGLQRDSLQQQINAQRLDNQFKEAEYLKFLKDNGFKQGEDGSLSLDDNFVSDQKLKSVELKDKSASASRNARVDHIQEITGTSDMSGTLGKTVADTAGILDVVTRALTDGTKASDEGTLPEGLGSIAQTIADVYLPPDENSKKVGVGHYVKKVGKSAWNFATKVARRFF